MEQQKRKNPNPSGLSYQNSSGVTIEITNKTMLLWGNLKGTADMSSFCLTKAYDKFNSGVPGQNGIWVKV